MLCKIIMNSKDYHWDNQGLKNKKSADFTGTFANFKRSRADSNRCGSFCRALPDHSATGPFLKGTKVVKIFLEIFNGNMRNWGVL